MSGQNPPTSGGSNIPSGGSCGGGGIQINAHGPVVNAHAGATIHTMSINHTVSCHQGVGEGDGQAGEEAEGAPTEEESNVERSEVGKLGEPIGPTYLVRGLDGSVPMIPNGLFLTNAKEYSLEHCEKFYPCYPFFHRNRNTREEAAKMHSSRHQIRYDESVGKKFKQRLKELNKAIRAEGKKVVEGHIVQMYDRSGLPLDGQILTRKSISRIVASQEMRKMWQADPIYPFAISMQCFFGVTSEKSELLDTILPDKLQYYTRHYETPFAFEPKVPNHSRGSKKQPLVKHPILCIARGGLEEIRKSIQAVEMLEFGMSLRTQETTKPQVLEKYWQVSVNLRPYGANPKNMKTYLLVDKERLRGSWVETSPTEDELRKHIRTRNGTDGAIPADFVKMALESGKRLGQVMGSKEEAKRHKADSMDELAHASCAVASPQKTSGSPSSFSPLRFGTRTNFAMTNGSSMRGNPFQHNMVPSYQPSYSYYDHGYGSHRASMYQHHTSTGQGRGAAAQSSQAATARRPRAPLLDDEPRADSNRGEGGSQLLEALDIETVSLWTLVLIRVVAFFDVIDHVSICPPAPAYLVAPRGETEVSGLLQRPHGKFSKRASRLPGQTSQSPRTGHCCLAQISLKVVTVVKTPKMMTTLRQLMESMKAPKVM